jgi:YhgE/Pip-like protein
MTALRLAATELRRVTAGRLPRAALIALVLVPTLYGGLYLHANKDPYSGLSRVPAAVVVDDAGTTLANGERLAVGNRVAAELVRSKSFGWHRVSRQAAHNGVQDGTYDFALVLPRDFSAALASSADFRPRQADLQIETNDANNYLTRTIANQLVAQVTKSVAAQVTSTAANQLLVGFATIHDKVGQAATGAGRLSDGLGTADTGHAGSPLAQQTSSRGRRSSPRVLTASPRGRTRRQPAPTASPRAPSISIPGCRSSTQARRHCLPIRASSPRAPIRSPTATPVSPQRATGSRSRRGRS